eukprot:TRINITY_DN6_c0_g1_i1.p1 TRINITY_DN6_c0_g1~~TRINITY_DN6_c0_g1_i1.p1  ORF type:complete len:109 (-),score=36.19 TRINITY_DN6_c0_g1_i1:178-504(-)
MGKKKNHKLIYIQKRLEMSKYLQAQSLGPAQSNKIEVEYDSDDDWDTEPDYENSISEKEQRWGSIDLNLKGKDLGIKDMSSLRNAVVSGNEQNKVQHSSQKHEYGEQN